MNIYTVMISLLDNPDRQDFELDRSDNLQRARSIANDIKNNPFITKVRIDKIEITEDKEDVKV